jgi:hypothetical protein
VGAKVLDSVFVSQPDDRVTPLADEVLLNMDVDLAAMSLVLSRPGSLAVQALVANTVHSFTSQACEHMIRTCLSHAAEAAAATAHLSLLSSLVANASTRSAVLRKGDECGLLLMRASLAVLFQGSRASTDPPA